MNSICPDFHGESGFVVEHEKGSGSIRDPPEDRRCALDGALVARLLPQLDHIHTPFDCTRQQILQCFGLPGSAAEVEPGAGDALTRGSSCGLRFAHSAQPRVRRLSTAPTFLQVEREDRTAEREEMVRPGRASDPALLPAVREPDSSSAASLLSFPARIVGAVARSSVRAVEGTARALGLDSAVRSVVDRTITGPIAAQITRQLIEQGVIERVSGELIAGGVPQKVVDQVLDSDVPEQVLDRVLSPEVTMRLTQRALAQPGIVPAANEVLESRVVDEISETVLESDELAGVIEKIANSEEVRDAIAQQSFGLITELGAQASAQTRKLDGWLEKGPRRMAGKPARTGPVPEAGLASRGLAFAIDYGVVSLFLFLLSAAVNLITNFFTTNPPGVVALLLGAIAFGVTGAIYLLAFWTLDRQTPGMRFMRLRIEPVVEDDVSFWDALRRLVGFVVSFVFLVGYLMILFSDRRRGLLDRFGDTVVIYVPERIPERFRMSHEQRES